MKETKVTANGVQYKRVEATAAEMNEIFDWGDYNDGVDSYFWLETEETEGCVSDIVASVCSGLIIVDSRSLGTLQFDATEEEAYEWMVKNI